MASPEMNLDFLTPTKSQIADWARLGQKRTRRQRGLFLIEGEVCTREARGFVILKPACPSVYGGTTEGSAEGSLFSFLAQQSEST
jgi:hypothetical protein